MLSFTPEYQQYDLGIDLPNPSAVLCPYLTIQLLQTTTQVRSDSPSLPSCRPRIFVSDFGLSPPTKSKERVAASLSHPPTTTMGAFFDSIPQDLIEWAREQKVFWVASAPLSGRGNVNVSPRGHDSLVIVDSRHCYFVDMTGSGNETISHLQEPGNGRITIMLNAFDGPPRIVRFFGKGRTIPIGTPEFKKILPDGDERILPGTRALIWVDIHGVGSSCGMSVPFFSYEGDRMALQEWSQKRMEADESGDVKNGLKAYWAMKNSESIDGLPGFQVGIDLSKKGVVPTPSEAFLSKLRLQKLDPHGRLWDELRPSNEFLQGALTSLVLCVLMLGLSRVAQGSSLLGGGYIEW